MRALAEGEHDAYELPRVASERASLFEHCLRAIEHGITSGPHGLPLVSRSGRAFTSNYLLSRPMDELRPALVSPAALRVLLAGEHPPLAPAGDALSREVARLASMLELAWDGEWYLRGYFDDGGPLGSARNGECRIDSLPQSWAVLAGFTSKRRPSRPSTPCARTS
jgi:cyclic beta-1,2-glucan synthetase